MTTVTIQLDDEVLNRVSKLASLCNISVVEMIQRLIDVRLSEPLRPEDLGPNTRAATGIAPAMTDEEVKATLDEEKMRKFGGG